MSGTELLQPHAAQLARDVRLIASDLDGTLIGPDFRFSERTRRALTAVEAAGIPVVFVTGRPARWLTPLRELHALRAQLGEGAQPIGAVICSNGAAVYDLASERMLESRTVEAATVLEVVARLRAAVPQAIFSAETLGGVAVEPGWLGTDTSGIQDARIGRFEEVLAPEDRVVKLLAKAEDLEADAFVAAVREQVGELVAVTHSVPQAPLAEMAQRGLSKARTLADHCAQHGIAPGQVLALGDMPNDLEMLRWAGYGFAMASGMPSVVQAVDRTAPAFDDDGAAQVLEALLAQRAELGLTAD